MKKSPFSVMALFALVLSLGGCVWYGPGHGGWHGDHDGGGWHGGGDHDGGWHGGEHNGGWH